jgi:hypothetical protein
VYEDGTLISVAVLLRSGRGMSEDNGGDELNGVLCTHIWKGHNETPCTTIIYKEERLKECDV